MATIRSKLFRAIEASHPEIEHLGNWHTHHVNGYPTLSGGDKTTYFKTVNHEKHNTDFFYALLVVSKNRGGNPRYAVKHFIFRRGDDAIYEIPAKDVRLVDAPLLRPRRGEIAEPRDARRRRLAAERGQSRARQGSGVFRRFYPGLKPLLSKDIGAPYWKGPLSLVDGSRAEVVAMEIPTTGRGPIRSPAPPRIRPSPTSSSSTRNANSARRGMPFCISNAISIRRFIAARRGKGHEHHHGECRPGRPRDRAGTRKRPSSSIAASRRRTTATVAYVKEMHGAVAQGPFRQGPDPDRLRQRPQRDRRRLDRAAQVPPRLGHVPDLLQGQRRGQTGLRPHQ